MKEMTQQGLLLLHDKKRVIGCLCSTNWIQDPPKVIKTCQQSPTSGLEIGPTNHTENTEHRTPEEKTVSFRSPDEI